MIQVDFIQMDDYPADSCAISPTALLLALDFDLLYMQNVNVKLKLFEM